MAKGRGRDRRRNRTQHVGVKLKVLTRTGYWVARYVDPLTGREKQESLKALTTEEARTSWARSKAKKLERLRLDLSAGKVIETRTGLEAAINNYLDGLTRKAPTTVALYRVALNHLLTWARKAHVANIEDLTGKHLTSLSKYLHRLKAKTNASGTGVGRKARKQSDRLLAPASVNQFVRGIRTFLRDCRRNELTPHLDGDMVQDRLPYADREASAPRFLKAKQIRAVIEACERHDAATFTRFRWSNPKHYPAITPLVTAALLTGCRFGELATLRWEDCDLDAGVIELAAANVKTRQSRRIALKESPALWAMLERMKLQAGGAAFVFGGDAPLQRAQAEPCRKRAISNFGAPRFSWHDLRRTCGTFLTCAPGIYAGASAFLSAKRLGHSVTVAERFYVGAVDVPVDASTLEAAMGIDDLLPRREVKQGAKIG